VGGVAGSASIESSLLAKFDGTIQFDGLRTVTTENNDGEKIQIVIGRTGELRIMDVKNDRLLITNNVPYGATLLVKDGQQIKKGEAIVSNSITLSMVSLTAKRPTNKPVTVRKWLSKQKIRTRSQPW
jgi:hypothetical protein